MTIDEAIEILKDYLRGDEPDNAPDLPASIRLGIEALKRVKAYKEAHVGLHYEPMPGETKD